MFKPDGFFQTCRFTEETNIVDRNREEIEDSLLSDALCFIIGKMFFHIFDQCFFQFPTNMFTQWNSDIGDLSITWINQWTIRTGSCPDFGFTFDGLEKTSTSNDDGV